MKDGDYLVTDFGQWLRIIASEPPDSLILEDGRRFKKQASGVWGMAKKKFHDVVVGDYILTECDGWHLVTGIDGDDEYPDMCIGRLSATRPQDVTTYVQKVIAHETSDPAAWHTDSFDSFTGIGFFFAVCEKFFNIVSGKIFIFRNQHYIRVSN